VNNGADTSIDFGNGSSITFIGLDPTDLSAQNFKFGQLGLLG